MECKILGKRLKTIININAVTSPEINIFSSPDKICMQNSSDGRVVLLETIIKPKALEQYSSAKGGMEVAKIDSINLKKYFSNIADDEIVEIKIDKTYANFKAKKSNYKQRLIDSTDTIKFVLPDERKKSGDKLPLEFDYEVLIENFEEFKKCINTGKTIEDIIYILVDKTKIILESKSKLGEFSAFFDDINIHKCIKPSKSMMQVLELSQFFNYVNRKFILLGGTDIPIKIIMKPYNFVEVKYLQAPRVELEV